jgi:Protein of unknown function (DUF3108)
VKRFVLGLFLLVFLASFCGGKQDSLPILPNTSFSKGEVLDYRVNFGFFTVGHAVTKVENRVFTVNSKPCYKVDAYGSTSGLISWLSKVDDQWGAYIDTSSLIPQVSYRKLKEGHFRRDEVVTFDHHKNQAEVKLMNKTTGVYDNVKYYPIPENVRDIVAGFMLLRVIDFTQYKKGDTLAIVGFLEDKSYRLKIIYGGKEKIHGKVGKIMCHKLVPIVPDNKLFDGENSVTAWISADANKIPIKVQASMFIGSTGIELVNYKGLRNPLLAKP